MRELREKKDQKNKLLNNANSPKYNKSGEFAGLKIGGLKSKALKPSIFNKDDDLVDDNG